MLRVILELVTSDTMLVPIQAVRRARADARMKMLRHSPLPHLFKATDQ